jgi:two-component system nitrate/nitrite response regulator NarL
MRGDAVMGIIQDRWPAMRPATVSAGKSLADLAGQGVREPAGRLVVASQVEERRHRWIERLQDAFEVHHVAERKSLERVMTSVAPDVLVIDLALPGLGRLADVSDVQRLSPSTRIIVLTNAPTDSEGLLAIKAGVKGYCPATIDPQQLAEAVAAVHAGEIWAPRRLVSGIIAEWLLLAERLETRGQQLPGHSCLENLTARQRAVAYLIGRGACNKEIAKRLNITERTVKAHLTEVFRSAGVSGRLQLALLVKGRPPHTGSRTPAR